MSNYIVTTNFAVKDSLPTGNPQKVAKGTEVMTEFTNIATAVASKLDIAQIGVASGVAGLDASARVALANLPLGLAIITVPNTWSAAQTFTALVSINSAANTNGLTIQGVTTSGQSFGAQIKAGTTSSDYGLKITNAAGTTTTLLVNGDGSGTAGAVGTTWSHPGGLSVAQNASIGGTLTVTGAVTGNSFAGSGASLTSLNASNLASGAVPYNIEGSGGNPSSSGTGGSNAQFLWLNNTTPTWTTVAFTNLNGTIGTSQVPSAAVTQFANVLETRNISGKSGTSKTLSHSAPSGGVDGDIWYVF